MPSSTASVAGAPSPRWSGCSRSCWSRISVSTRRSGNDSRNGTSSSASSYAAAIRAAQAAGAARLDIDPDVKAIEVIAFLNGLETSWLLNPSIPSSRRRSVGRLQRASLTTGIGRPRGPVSRTVQQVVNANGPHCIADPAA